MGGRLASESAAQVRAREAIMRKSVRDWRDLPLKSV